MRLSTADYLSALATAGIAGLGGAAFVLADVDDSPGGMLIGVLMVIGAAAFALWRTKRNT